MLSESDTLKLNVLLNEQVHAVRLDESRMRVIALTERGEATVQLQPDARSEVYLRTVRDWLSMRVLGAPGGYPPYIHRWTRMGQGHSDRALAPLLLLGDREAVVAVAHATELTEELARRVWWIGEDADVARSMLTCQAVFGSDLGSAMVQHLLEHLPFEEEPVRVVESLTQILAHPSLAAEKRAELWQRAHRQSAYAVGFLAAAAEPPADRSAHSLYKELSEAQDGDARALAQRLRWALSATGQNVLATLTLALRRLPDQETATALCKAVGRVFAIDGVAGECRDVASVEAAAHTIAPVYDWERDPRWMEMRLCCLYLALVGEHLLDPLLGVTDAVGSVMRKRLEPALGPVGTWAEALTDA